MAGTALRGRLTWQVATVTSVTRETASVATIVLEVPDWPGHQPGQHVDVRLTARDGYTAERSYSIATAADEPVAITVEWLADGEVSPYLTGELRAGDRLELRGPIGRWFVWDTCDGGPLHGAWADGSSWSKVIAGLRSQGVKAMAAPLPLTCLADDVAALDQTLERVEGPVVVAGNAYAGAVIPSTSDEKVASLVYVAALAPDEGETVGDIFYRPEPHPQAPVLGPDRHGLIWLPDAAFGRAFAQNASRLEQALLAATQRPLAVACIGTPVLRPAWKDRPSWFLVVGEDRMITAETQRFMAKRMKARVRTAPADHMPMVTAPAAVVDILLEAIREVEAR